MDESWTVLRDLAQKALKALEKPVEGEAFFTATQTTEVAIRNSEILTQNRLNDAGVGFRVFKDGKTGFACTNALNENAIVKTAERALAIARVSSQVPDYALPLPGKLSQKTFYDPRVACMPVSDVVDMAKRVITAAEDTDPRVVAKSGRVILQTERRGIINTQGLNCEEQGTKAAILLGGVGNFNGEVTGVCSDSVFSRTADVSPEAVGESVGEKVVHMFNPHPVKTFKGTVIFGPKAVSYQLTDVLIDALKGESVMAKRSFWTEKIGQKVASLVTVRDNGILENGFSSRRFDDEGFPSQNTLVLQNGVLKSYLHCALTANALHQENTGNASRSPGGFDLTRNIIGSGYRTQPEVYPSNLVIDPGSRTREELIAEVEKGVLIESMDGFAQQGSGLVSARLSQAFFIKNGEIKYPLKSGMVSGIAFDWFNRISGVGDDAKKFEYAVVPSLRVEDVTIVGE